MTGNNAFSVKKLLSVENLTTNYLVSIWMDKMGLASNPAMRKQVKNYRAYFNAKDRRLKVSTQNKIPETSDVDLLVDSGLRGLKFIGLSADVRKALDKDIDIFDVTHIEPNSKIDDEIKSAGVLQLNDMEEYRRMTENFVMFERCRL